MTFKLAFYENLYLMYHDMITRQNEKLMQDKLRLSHLDVLGSSQ